MTRKERLKIRLLHIDNAISQVEQSLSRGDLSIKSYTIDGISIVKTSPIELLKALQELKNQVLKAMRPNVSSMRFNFGGY